MKVAVFSHKEVWRDPTGGPEYFTVGGFPSQMNAISELFDETEIFCLLQRGVPPAGHQALKGPGMTVRPRSAPIGRGQVRKLLMPLWVARNGAGLWRMARDADAVHAVLLGDIGALGLTAALALRKPLFARHCGMWTYSETLAARITKRILIACAGGWNVVMATGGGDQSPEPSNPAIEWIFATGLSEEDFRRMPVSRAWQAGSRLKLVTVGRLSRGKNVDVCIRALPIIQGEVPEVSLTVVGDGQELKALKALTSELGVPGTVRFVGNQPREEVFRILAESHIFVFPSAAEGFPKAVLEAMACGLPVVASRVSVLPHLLADGCGELLAGTTADDVAEAVIRLAGDPERMAAMGRAARERARGYTLERWRDLIGERLEAAWGCPLKQVDGEPGGGCDS